MMRKFMIEREIQGVGTLGVGELGTAARTSNEALAKLDGVQWQYSFVTRDKTFCVYLAHSEALIHEHARLSGFPANKVTEITGMIDPSTEQQCQMAQATA